MTGLAFDDLNELIRGRVGIFSVVCPLCAPNRKGINQRRSTMKIWRRTPDKYATFCCAHCGARGYAFGDGAPRMDRQAFRASRELIETLDKTEVENSRAKARSLWRRSRPIEGTPAERYIREVRGIHCELPATLAYLEPRDGYPCAMIAAFGMPREIAPGELCIDPDDVVGVHLTKIAWDGRAKAGTAADKITIGKDHTMPVVLMPPTDMMSIVIAEGIEDAMSAGSVLSMGAWAAGSAGRLPGVAEHIPDWIEAVTVMVDDDRDGKGERNSGELARELTNRGIEACLVKLKPP
jgi:hypothetical protein